VRRGDDVRVLGEGFTIEEEEDMIVRSVTRLWINQCRYKIEVDMMTAGNWVMIEGID
jgi:116 kDa U5 small nuclear ribonucleoprotein component